MIQMKQHSSIDAIILLTALFQNIFDLQ